MSTESSDTKRPRSAMRRGVRVAGVLIACACLIGAAGWMASEYSYTVDIFANLGAQWMIVCVASVAVLAVMRQRPAVWIALAACVLQAGPLVTNRAAFWPRGLTEGARDAEVVRVMHYNDSCLSDKRLVYDLMERSGADVISILCPPVSMQAEVNYGRGLEDKYAGKLTRQWGPKPDMIQTGITAGILVSKWPMERFDASIAGALESYFLAGIVRRPGGAFGVVCVHPRSPRNEDRWREGNMLLEATIGVVNAMERTGVPVVVLTDLNATPTGYRSRRLCGETGLRHAKPLLSAIGTFPATVPLNIRTNQRTDIRARWPASIVIDDALVSPQIGVLGWHVGGHLASEHKPVTADLRIPLVGPWESNPGDR